MIVVTTVVLGLGSAADVGRNNQYTRIWPGLKRQKSLRQTGSGSHTASSHTSLSASGCARDSAEVAAIMLERNRKGEEAIGDESTRTRCADGVEGTASTEASKRR